VGGDDDRALAARAAEGDVAAFSLLVARHERKVRAFLSRLCRGSALADDLAQDTFLQAWRMAGAFRGEGGYRGWLMGIAWRRFLSETRRRGWETQAAQQGPEPQFTPEPGMGLDVSRALARLEPRERAAALLCFAEGCSHSEAAVILGVPLGTLKSLAARARLKLTTDLEGGVPS